MEAWRVLALPCHETFSWTMGFRRGMGVSCHSRRSAAPCGTRHQLRGSRRCCPVSSSTAARPWVGGVCEEFAFADARGRLQVAGCLKALTALAGRRPEIVLPQPKSPAVDRRPRLLADGCRCA